MTYKKYLELSLPVITVLGRGRALPLQIENIDKISKTTFSLQTFYNTQHWTVIPEKKVPKKVGTSFILIPPSLLSGITFK